MNVSLNSEGRTIAGTLYYPEDPLDEYPAIVFIGGWSSHRDMYSWIGEYMAANGYIAFLIDGSGNGGSEGILSGPGRKKGIGTLLRSALESPICFLLNWWTSDIVNSIHYLIAESPVRDLVDADRIGTMGHSMGGFAVSRVRKSMVEGGKIQGVVALSDVGLLNVGRLEVPIQIQTGDVDLVPNDSLVAGSGYYLANPPKQLIRIKGGTHGGFTDASYGPEFNWQKDLSKHYALAWFNYYLKGDVSAYDYITSPHEHLSFIYSSKYDLGDGDEGRMRGKKNVRGGVRAPTFNFI